MQQRQLQAQPSCVPSHAGSTANRLPENQAGSPGMVSSVRCSVSCSQRLKSSGESTRCSTAGPSCEPH